MLGLALAVLSVSAHGADARPDDFEAKVAPFLAKHCSSCHNGEKKKGDLSFEGFKDSKTALGEPKVWEKVLKKLAAREMPPKARPQPAQPEIDAIVPWLESALFGGRSGAKDPGRVTMRRLNRAEYNNTVRDLLGIDFQPADDFPSDDVGYGFDNIGDVLSLPPLLAEKYLAAAEKIVEKVIDPPEPPKPNARRYEAENIESTAAQHVAKSSRVTLSSIGEVRTKVTFREDGQYLLRASAYGVQAGPEPVRMAFRIDGQDAATVNVEAVKASPRTYETKAEIKAGERLFGVAFLNDFSNPADPDPEKRERNLVVDYIEVEGPVAVKRPKTPADDMFLACDLSGGAARECLRKIIGGFATRAYRRPATEDEVNRLLSLADVATRDGGSAREGLRLALEAVLVSPHFLFRIEKDAEPANPDAAHLVSEPELATRLSYFLWSTMPDDELFALAREGNLRKDGNLEAEARRMLKDPRARALTENFCGQWLTIRNLATVTPDKTRFPGFDDELRAAMRRETELFFEAIVKEDRSVLEFIDSDFTFLNERLAKHYGYPGVRGSEFRRVPLVGGKRGGILTQASVLTVTSNPTRTSPVKRGKWVLEQFLGTPPPPPPPGVVQLKEGEQVELKGSLRQRMEQHRTDPGCAACHSRMDPIGFGLENFDGVGAWRERDGKFPIDPSGELPDGRSFRGPAELKALLMAQEEQFTRALAEKMLTFALGRGLEYYDRRAVDRITAAVRSKKHRFSSVVLEILKSDPFQMRRGERSPE